jgi:hypothetical protein
MIGFVITGVAAIDSVEGCTVVGWSVSALGDDGRDEGDNVQLMTMQLHNRTVRRLNALNHLNMVIFLAQLRAQITKTLNNSRSLIAIS